LARFLSFTRDALILKKAGANHSGRFSPLEFHHNFQFGTFSVSKFVTFLTLSNIFKLRRQNFEAGHFLLLCHDRMEESICYFDRGEGKVAMETKCRCRPNSQSLLNKRSVFSVKVSPKRKCFSVAGENDLFPIERRYFCRKGTRRDSSN
jgi:hypothetical protein